MRPFVAVIALSTACSQLLGTPDVHHEDCDPEAAFAHLAPVGGIDDELGLQAAQLSHDERILVFSRLTLAGPEDAPVSRHGDLYMAHRDHLRDAFRDTVALDAVNTDFDELTASLSDDAQTLYFDRQDAFHRYHVFATSRFAPGPPPDAPVLLNLEEGDPSDLEPFITPSALYFASRRSDGSASLFVAPGSGTAFAAARQLSSLETISAATPYESPVVTADDLTIYFSAPLSNGVQPDIWSASRQDPAQPFDPPHPVTELNSMSAERPAWISTDRCRLYFVTNRAGHGFALWMASRAAP